MQSLEHSMNILVDNWREARLVDLTCRNFAVATSQYTIYWGLLSIAVTFSLIRNSLVNDHRLKAVASAYGLKPDWVGPGGQLASWLDDFEVVVRYLGLLTSSVTLPIVATQ